jgi:hypothetical protein
MAIPGDDRRDAEVYVTGLPVELVPQLPSRPENRDHMAADDTEIRGNVPERSRQVAERDITEIIGDRRGAERQPGQGRSSSHCRSLPSASIRSAPPRS